MSKKSSQNSSLPIPFWGRISFLWLLLVPIVCAMYTLLLPIAPNDFWYNVRAGSVIMGTGQIPTTALFTTSLPAGTPYYYQSWISQLLLFNTLQMGGLSGIILLRTFCLTVSFALLVWLCWGLARQVDATTPEALPTTTLSRVVALCSLLAFTLAASNMDIRPQTFSVLLFTVWICLIFKWPTAPIKTRARIAIALAALMVLWANTHGAFFTGLVVLGAFFIGEALHLLLARKRPGINRIFGTAPTGASLQSLGIVVALCALAPLLNPRGAMIYFYVFKLAGLKAGQKFIQEWQSPSFDQWFGAMLFISMIGVCVLAIVLLLHARFLEQSEVEASRGAFGARLGEVAVLVCMAILALRDIRSIIWFGILLAPVMTAMYTRLLSSRDRPAHVEDSPPKSIQVVNAIIAFVLVFACVPFLPAYKSGLGLPPEYASHFAPTPKGQFPSGFSSDPGLLLDRDTPVEAVEYLRKNPPRGRVWNDMVFGSYLTWAGVPGILPHCDPRVEMYPYAFWEEYGRLIEGPADAPKTLRTQGFSDALLHAKDEKPLIARLEKNGWRILLKKGTSVLLRDKEK